MIRKTTITTKAGRLTGRIRDPDGTLFYQRSLIFAGIGGQLAVRKDGLQVVGSIDLIVDFVLSHQSGTDEIRVYRPRIPLEPEELQMVIEHFTEHGWAWKKRR